MKHRPLAKIEGGKVHEFPDSPEISSDFRPLFFSALYFFPPSIFISDDPRNSRRAAGSQNSGLLSGFVLLLR